MRILFGIMSAVQPAETVASLVDALGTRHPVLIHHDWSQQPDFRLSRANVSYVEKPQRTGWANWGFSQGILRLITEAMERERFDYFQLLSPTCLPVRPVEAFEAHLSKTRADFLVDAIRLDSDPNVLMSHGWRAYAAASSLRHLLLRRARKWYFGDGAMTASRSGLSFPVTSMVGDGGATALLARLGHAITSHAQKGQGFSHPFSRDFPCYVGSTWFTASRGGCEYLLSRAQDDALTNRFARLYMGDEMYFPSLFRNSGMPCAPAAHYIARFIDARPAWFELSDLDEIRRSGAYFARKFPEDPGSAVRKAVRALLVRQGRRSETVEQDG